MLQFLTILSAIIGITVGGFGIYDYIRKSGGTWKVYAIVAAAALLVSLVLTILSQQI